VREVGTGHLRVDLKSEAGGTLRAMAFRSVGTPLGEFLTVNRGRTVHVAGNISGNYWNGARNVQFRVLDAALA